MMESNAIDNVGMSLRSFNVILGQLDGSNIITFGPHEGIGAVQ